MVFVLVRQGLSFEGANLDVMKLDVMKPGRLQERWWPGRSFLQTEPLQALHPN